MRLRSRTVRNGSALSIFEGAERSGAKNLVERSGAERNLRVERNGAERNLWMERSGAERSGTQTPGGAERSEGEIWVVFPF